MRYLALRPAGQLHGRPDHPARCPSMLIRQNRAARGRAGSALLCSASTVRRLDQGFRRVVVHRQSEGRCSLGHRTNRFATRLGADGLLSLRRDVWEIVIVAAKAGVPKGPHLGLVDEGRATVRLGTWPVLAHVARTSRRNRMLADELVRLLPANDLADHPGSCSRPHRVAVDRHSAGEAIQAVTIGGRRTAIDQLPLIGDQAHVDAPATQIQPNMKHQFLLPRRRRAGSADPTAYRHGGRFSISDGRPRGRATARASTYGKRRGKPAWRRR
jgi:hypothetical protein